MESLHIPYKDTGYFSNIMLDYLAQKENLRPFYNRFPSIENFEAQIEEKSQFYSSTTRKVLVNAIEKQYQKLEISAETQQNIDNLVLPTTFTITTGHQLNLFSGPLYFLYKIVSVINLCKELKAAYPKHNFVPIYWMASEDHDFEEIQYFNFKSTKISWKREASGAVGRLDTSGLSDVYQEFSSLLNSGTYANELRSIFKNAYLEQNNLAEASRYLVNALFSKYGLVVVDGDDSQLKTLFKPYALQELEEQVSFKNVTETNVNIEKEGYKIQVNPREINLFYIGDGFRERIVKQESGYKVLNTNLVFKTAEDLFKNSDKLEFVSGNALLRPLYQEVILPNLCYVGGGGELAYWMQLKTTFKSFKVPFPVLLLRNSALLVSPKQQKKTDKLGLELKDFFLSQNDLIKKKVNELSTINFDFKAKRKQLEATFKELEILSSKTDKSFIGAVKAQEAKQLKGLDRLEKRLLKAEKKKMYELVTRIEILQNELFPHQSLEERHKNFSDYYEEYGGNLIDSLLVALKPLAMEFTVIKL
ncbi:bacillithiol biosynthesis cysteine-adding enzyme BshC [Wenyingzhuangia aestuarii]|uniref:bacillithiol biosynthesis cysteine-adding enzyme BshC n=1 Tax=Wenyingzhuangia aestuarii TaxID=1647582 RepID=UPI00143A0DB6|nr:bacillithiol biosynthesis cysteine-adding enzyme BshC [Wenyingzhuangia aestuarii]NJB81679.1 bacillithiol biosynthesis cysteine-adding enzyme BshC [Wenyingzhuangia aestuarii]